MLLRLFSALPDPALVPVPVLILVPVASPLLLSSLSPLPSLLPSCVRPRASTPVPVPVPVPILRPFVRLHLRSCSCFRSYFVSVSSLFTSPSLPPTPLPSPFLPLTPIPPRPRSLLPVPRVRLPPRYNGHIQTPGLVNRAVGCSQRHPLSAEMMTRVE